MTDHDEVDLDSGPDPADFAAADPEPDWTDGADPAVRAVGIGPGAAEFLTPRGREAIRSADVVIGFETVLDYVADAATGETLACGYRDEAATLATFADRIADGATGVAVLMGDPNHSGYQFVGKVQRAVADALEADDDRSPVQVVPGISSLQVAASRARTPMEATTFVTLHKSGPLDDDLERLRADAGERHLLVLPRPYDWMPGDVAAHLIEAGADPDATALVLEKLTHDDETVTHLSLGALADEAGGDEPEDSRFSDLSVLAVRRP
ncbi:cobalt-precorrin-7 (C(5))-methyltransferase [Haloparvum sedimenti]|uniref:cobalt-precorrin-7 (C(5))-methyltransferase n=1 Tax=Haloparvum sedimenti TaxID=1678448 RepID=UPI00071E8431|nr:cobalt-precorrin-7 (C(5))-methyltransferase [Haloparvum sedimenti]